MTSTRERQQRAAARARLERQMAERQEAARRRRQLQAAIGAASALLLIIAGVVWAALAFSGGDDPETPPVADPGEPAGAAECTWLPENPAENPNLQEVGTPPPGEPRSGVSTITITTNHGVIEAEMDTALVPCTAASFAHLAGQEFYDGTSCHRLVTAGIQVLQCGDPSGTGSGGPTYKYAEENLPVNDEPPYPPGSLAMAKTQAPSSTGSQFFIVYGDSQLAADYTLVGTITQGLDIVERIAADGNAEDGVAPATEVVIETLRVSDPA